MDVMQLRRNLLMQMIGGGDMAQSKSGTSIGDGTKSISLQIGFEPDIVVIDSGLKASEAGYAGLLLVAIAKDKFTFNMYHNSDTDTNASRSMNAKFTDGMGWGNLNTVGSYRNIATYSNGILTVTNVTNNPASSYCFINDIEYAWTAYKA